MLLAPGSGRGRHHERVEILLWWLPPVVVTAIAMVWVGWLGRARPTGPDRSDAAQERFAQAILRDLPTQVTRQVSAPRPLRERSTGIAVRPSQQPRAPHRAPHEGDADQPDQRRSA